MKYVLVSIVTVVSLTLLSYRNEEDDIITWSKSRPLTWNDYRGKPQPRFAAASTVYSLHHYLEKETNGNAIAFIKAYFYCKDSWKKDDWISESVLSHEQKHFDIVELYARKLRKELGEMSFTTYKSADGKLDSLYHVISKEMDVYQDKYDDETDGSMNGDQQRKWEKKIVKEIEALSKYENPAVPLKIRSAATD